MVRCCAADLPTPNDLRAKSAHRKGAGIDGNVDEAVAAHLAKKVWPSLVSSAPPRGFVGVVLGGLVTAAVANAGFDLGADLAFLVSTPIGAPVYARLGLPDRCLYPHERALRLSSLSSGSCRGHDLRCAVDGPRSHRAPGLLAESLGRLPPESSVRAVEVCRSPPTLQAHLNWLVSITTPSSIP